MMDTRAKIQEEILPEQCLQSFKKLNEYNQPSILSMALNIYISYLFEATQICQAQWEEGDH